MVYLTLGYLTLSVVQGRESGLRSQPYVAHDCGSCGVRSHCPRYVARRRQLCASTRRRLSRKKDEILGDRYAAKVRMNRDARYGASVLIAEARTERLNDEREALNSATN